MLTEKICHFHMGISQYVCTLEVFLLLSCATEPRHVAKSWRMMGALQGLRGLYHTFCTSRKPRALQRHLANCMGARRDALHSQLLSLLVDKRGPRGPQSHICPDYSTVCMAQLWPRTTSTHSENCETSNYT